MKIEFLGTTSSSGHCPSAFKTDRGTYLVQGWKVADEEALAEVRRRGLPDHEAVVEIPAGLIDYFRQAT